MGPQSRGCRLGRTAKGQRRAPARARPEAGRRGEGGAVAQAPWCQTGADGVHRRPSPQPAPAPSRPRPPAGPGPQPAQAPAGPGPSRPRLPARCVASGAAPRRQPLACRCGPCTHAPSPPFWVSRDVGSSVPGRGPAVGPARHLCHPASPRPAPPPMHSPSSPRSGSSPMTLGAAPLPGAQPWAPLGTSATPPPPAPPAPPCTRLQAPVLGQPRRWEQRHAVGSGGCRGLHAWPCREGRAGGAGCGAVAADA